MTDETGTIEPQEFRRVLGSFPTGVTVVTADGPAGPVGVAIGSFASISLDPPLVGFFLGNQSSTNQRLRDAGSFCVNVLTHGQLELCAAMASKADDRFEGWERTPSPVTGSPVFAGIRAYIDCRLDDIIPVGDHDLFVGRVVALDTVDDAEPMVFHAGRYGSFGSSD
ncbi:MAG: flavin reductase family protein [Acidimicrobiia bacterium]|nr:flavin reductase family protein [Acidimicrobiia bacterium]